MGSSTARPLSGALGMMGAGAFVLQALLSVAAAVIGVLSALASALPIIIIALVVTAAMLPWVRYHDRWIEQAELSMRATVYPIYNETVREWLNLARRIYNPLICWWNAAAWWGYGMVREVLFPTALQCGVKNIATRVGTFIIAVAEDFVLHVVSGAFWSRDADFSRVSTTGIAMFQAWIDLYSCACSDLASVLKVTPIVSPLLVVPPLIPLIFFSAEWVDPQTWCAIGHAFNAACALLREALRLVQQVLYALFGQPLPGGVFIRPDLRQIVDNLCPAISCLVRSTENAYQLLWDTFVPFRFDFRRFICVVDALACILLKTVALALRILVNIERCVLYSQTAADQFWVTVIKADVIEIINLYVAPSQWANVNFPRQPNAPAPPVPTVYVMRDYYLDTASQTTPIGAPNPVFNATRLDECICIFIRRLICDPSDMSTGCFSTGAQNLLMGLDFCCATNVVLRLLADLVTFLFEFSLHLSNGPSDFFMFIDQQPFTTVVKDDLVDAVRCLFSIFGLIPVVGTCIRDLLTNIIRYVLCMIDFFARVINGLVTLPYFLVTAELSTPGIPNFLFKANAALDFFVQIHEDLIADTPSSVKNCLCVILNNGFPIPPVPCSSCVVGGFVAPPTTRRKSSAFPTSLFDPRTGKNVATPLSLLRELWQVENPSVQDATIFITPLLSYNRTEAAAVGGGIGHGMNPWTLYRRAMETFNDAWSGKNEKRFSETPGGTAANSIFSLGAANDFVTEKKREINERWDRRIVCVRAHEEAARLIHDNPIMYERNRLLGKYECNPNESLVPRYTPSRSEGGQSTGFAGSTESNGPAAAESASADSEDDEFHHSSSVGSGGASPTAPPVYINEDRVASLDYDESAAESLVQQGERLTLGPLEPNVTGCSNPTPRCFDVCCIFRSTLILLVHIIEFLARFFNGLIQGSKGIQGTIQDYPYFTGEFETTMPPKATFESDIISLILKLFVPIKCACQVFNLIIPVSPGTNAAFSGGRPDICCFVQRISELLACIIQVIINSINALAMGGSTNFVYFTAGMFKADVNILFDITLEVVVCLCIFVRAIFPLNYIPGIANATSFDICCIGAVLLNTIIEIVRGLVQVIISLATISVDPSSYCYWRLDRTSDHMCGGIIDDIGVVKQADVIIDSFFARHGEEGGTCKFNCGSDNGASGIAPCICQILNTLVPFRPFPDRPVSCDDDPAKRNCAIVDLCCPFSKLSFVIADSLKFINRGLVAFWQPWSNGLPEFFVHYVWCAEQTYPVCGRVDPNTGDLYPTNPNSTTLTNIIRPDPCQALMNTPIPVCPGTYTVYTDLNGDLIPEPQQRCGRFTCGKLNIVIADIAEPFDGLLAKCTCQLFSLLDQLLAFIFNFIHIIFPQAGWSCCFCGGLRVDDNGDSTCSLQEAGPCREGVFGSGSGVLPAISYIGEAVLKALFNLLRQFPLSCYWRPAYPNVPHIISETWIFKFLAPTADALCIAVGNLVCFAQSMFLLPSRCLSRGQKFVGGIVRWAAEVILRVIGFIEAFIQSFIGSPNTCVGPNCDQKAGSKEQSTKGVQAKPLGNMLVILLSIPTDLLIGDGDVGCTTICPSILAVPTPHPCECWNLSPMFGQGVLERYYPSNNATICRDPATGAPVGAPFNQPGSCCYVRNNTAGFPSPLPICQSPDDTQLQLAVPNVSVESLYNLTETGPLNYTYKNRTGEDVVPYVTPTYPGACAAYSACRPDALPSCANDPETPPGLSANYRGALDGIVMGFAKYLRCLLNNLLGCDARGKNCTQLGIIFYPAILIFSIMWQILGGIIRFIASMIIFFFSLFTPPDGGACSCWEHTEQDGYNFKRTKFYEQVGGLCYPCYLLDHKCGDLRPGVVGTDLCIKHAYACAPWCPYVQRRLAPTINETEAMRRCIELYENTTHVNTVLTPQQACTGHIVNYTVCDWARELNSSTCVDYFDPAYHSGTPNITKAGVCPGGLCVQPPTGLCNFFVPPGFYARGEQYQLLEACPDPNCQYYSDTNSTTGLSNTYCASEAGAKGYWPCSGEGGIFDNTYPANPVVTCGVIQIISNFLDVFNSFVAIFTTPLLITPSARRSLPAEQARSETRQSFNKRFEGTIFGLDVNKGGANIIESLTEAVYGYDTSDCYADPMQCVCRNFDIADHCRVDPATHQIVFGARGQRRRRSADGTRDEVVNMTVPDLTMMMKQEMFTGGTVCDHAVEQVAGHDWTNEAVVTMNQKHRFVSCVDRKIQGSRMQTLADIVPDDIMYNSQAPVTLMHNMFHTVRTQVTARAEKRSRSTSNAREEMERLFPNFDAQLIARQRFAGKVLSEQYNIKPGVNLMYDALVKFDRIWYKWHTGFYSFAVEKTMEGIVTGKYSILPSTAEALADVGQSIQELKRIIVNQPYQQLANTTYEAASIVARTAVEAMDEGVMTYLKRNLARHVSHRRNAHDTSPSAQKRDKLFTEVFYASPLVKWWSDGTASPAGTAGEQTKRDGAESTSVDSHSFAAHLSRTIAFQRQHWQTQSLTFFNADLKLWSLADIFVSRYTNVKPEWTPEKLENLERAKRVYYQMHNRIWPGMLPRDVQERYLFLSNCVILDRAVNITVKVVDYCANEAMPNLNFTRNAPSLRDGGGESSIVNDAQDGLSTLWSYVQNISPYREHSYYGYRNRGRFTLESSGSVAGGGSNAADAAVDPHAWVRPRLIATPAVNHSSHRVDYRVYRAATKQRMTFAAVDDVDALHGPANFNLFDWILVVVEDWFGYALGSQADTWFDDVKRWILNPNTDISLFPDVGLAFYLRYPFVCHFPENLNCSAGVGFEQALLWVTVGFIALFIFAAFFFPPIALPFQIIGIPLAYLFIFTSVAWFLSPSCLVMFPSFPLPFGVALPSCAMDQIMAFLDKWITTCYANGLVIPSYMVAGVTCPTDPNVSIDVLNCRDVGVSDGLQNLLYLGFWVLGSGFCDFVLRVTSTVLGTFIPGMQNYMEVTLNSFKTASPTQQQRLTFCFWATIPTILFPLSLLFLGGLVIALLVPPLLLLINSLVTLFFASPAAAAVPGADTSAWFGNDDEVPQPTSTTTVRDRRLAAGGAASPATLGAWVRNAWFGREKQKKE